MQRPQVFLILLLFVTYAMAQAGCGTEAQSQNPEPEEVEPTIPVEAVRVEIGDIAAYYAGTASLEADEEALVVAKAGGIVTTLFVEEGDRVQAGQKLAQLDDERLALELTRTEVTLNKLKGLFERNQELYNQQLISVEEYERVKSDYEAQQSAYDLAALSLANTTVRAPISGIISERQIKVGNMVQTHAPTFRITALDPLLAVMHVPERELQKLALNQPAQMLVDALPGRTFSGHIARISPVVDPMTGTFKVTIAVRNQDRKLKPGMFGRVGIVYDTHENTLLLPKAAVVSEDDESSVFFIQDDMAFRKVVETGYSDEQFIEINAGVMAGEQIISAGQSNLRDSTRVEVVVYDQ